MMETEEEKKEDARQKETVAWPMKAPPACQLKPASSSVPKEPSSFPVIL